MTEAVKKILDETGVNYSSNILASILSLILTIGVQFYSYYREALTMFTAELPETLALILLAFLAATLGYDKVSQILKQLKG